MRESAFSNEHDARQIVGIKNLEEEFDVALARELAQAFLDDTRSIVENLSDFARQKDLDGLRRCAHMLKGCARTIQACKCEESSSLLEGSARDGDFDAAVRHVPLVADAYAETERFLRQYLA